jgi:hypothetical protein
MINNAPLSEIVRFKVVWGFVEECEAERKIRGGVKILEWGWVRDARIAR